MEVISKSHAHRDVSERLLQQIAADFEKAQQFCESPSELSFGVLEATEVKWLTLYIIYIYVICEDMCYISYNIHICDGYSCRSCDIHPNPSFDHVAAMEAQDSAFHVPLTSGKVSWSRPLRGGLPDPSA